MGLGLISRSSLARFAFLSLMELKIVVLQCFGGCAEGLLYIRGVNNQYVTNAAFLVSVHSDYQTAAGLTLQCQSTAVTPATEFAFSKFQVQQSTCQVAVVVAMAFESEKMISGAFCSTSHNLLSAPERVCMDSWIHSGRYKLLYHILYANYIKLCTKQTM